MNTLELNKMKSINYLISYSAIIYILFQTGPLIAGITQNRSANTDASVIYSQGNIPTTWSESINVRWKTEIHGKAGLRLS